MHEHSELAGLAASRQAASGKAASGKAASARRGATASAKVTVVLAATKTRTKPDVVSTEEPLEIRVGDAAVAVTMRTPGHDFELAVGYLYTEGILTAPSDVREVRYCTKGLTGGPAGGLDAEVNVPQQYNIVTVDVRGDVDPTLFRRATVTSSSCGLCGTDSIEHIHTNVGAIADSLGASLTSDVLLTLPDVLRKGQPQFEKTGGLHGVGLFESNGRTVVIREDVGRHNALDKVIGFSVLRAGQASTMSLDQYVLVVSGRVSFEIVQKAAMARIPWIVAVGAPTSLAIDAAHELGITLAGFVNGESANLYTHAHRLTVE